MNLDRIFNIFGAIVTVALVFVLVSNRNTAAVIRSVGEAFSSSLRAAMGRGGRR